VSLIENIMKTCNKCDTEKSVKDFYRDSSKADSMASMCKDCKRDIDRAYAESLPGKITSILTSMRKRSKKLGFPVPEITRADIEAAIATGKCSVTGIPYVIDYNGSGLKNPFIPSPDRIDPTKGYTKDNVQWVVWIYNSLKWDYPQSEIDRILKMMQPYINTL